MLELVDDAFGRAGEGIATVARRSVELCCEHLGIDTATSVASLDHPSDGLTGVDRLLDICRSAGAGVYLNAPGGRVLYDEETFERRGVDLRFVDPVLSPYPQRSPGFVPGLSILDVLLNVPAAAAREVVAAGRV